MDWVAIFVITFREALEVALTLVLVVAATRSLPGRMRWIVGGFMAGLLGSVVVAALTERISESMQGMGQEHLNASLLGISAVLIGFTVIWMRKHSRDLVKNLKETSLAVLEGRKPMFALSLIIGLTVLRDGSEVVLLSQGLFASGISVFSLIFGALSGVVAGAALGIAMYFGIVKLKVSAIFDIVSIMLIFVAAGMAAQAAGFLVASGMLPPLSTSLWDSSGLLSEHTLIGELAHVLFGYTARPSGMQFLCYVATLGIIFCGWKRTNSSQSSNKVPVAAAAVVLLVTAIIGPAFPAHALDKIYSPMVHSGEIEFETRGTYDFDKRDDRDGTWKQKFGVGGALNDYWAMEIYAETEKDNGEEIDVEAVALENRWQLTEQGEYWLDWGLYFEYEHATQSQTADKLEGKILLEKTQGNLEHRLNIIFEKEIGGYSEEETEGELSAVSRYRLSKYYEPGIEWHSEFGELNKLGSWSEQEHYIGPALYGKMGGGFKYEIALLFGISTEATDKVLRGVVEYEWYL